MPGTVVLKAGRDSALLRFRHPWIYSQGLSHTSVGAEESLIRVLSSGGATLGWGLYSPDSLIAVRMVSFGAEEPEERWLEARIEAAYTLRMRMPLDSDAYRLVNSEGDFLPGLVIDVYGDTVVVSAHVRGIEVLLDRITACLEGLLKGKKVYLKRDEHYARVEGLTRASGYLSGSGDGTTVIREGRLSFLVDFREGQKTGFYLDQRENRKLAAGFASGKSVLNLFSYTGGFALHAAAAGAREIVSVESSQRAVDISRKNVELNPFLDPSAFQWRKGDAFELQDEPGRYQVAIVDPPPFARRRSEVEGALKGYTTINARALTLLESGGLLFTFSCSGVVDKSSYRRALAEAALKTGRRVRFLRELQADADHPVAAAHAEGEYLKGWVMHVE